MFRKLCCFCRIKGKKSESNSQLYGTLDASKQGCFCRIKGKKSESNSQQICFNVVHRAVVSAVSKVRNLKAIHNEERRLKVARAVVSAVSKVRNLKAIHNISVFQVSTVQLFLPYQR